MTTAIALACGCGADSDGAPTPVVRATPITVARAELKTVQVLETTVGRLETQATPAVAAETNGRIKEIRVSDGDSVANGALLGLLDDEIHRIQLQSAQAEIERLQALLDNQVLTVRRLTDLVRQKSASESLLDEAGAQQRALQAQLKNARAQHDDAAYQLDKTRIVSPIAGIVQRRLLSVGDYVTRGQPMFEIVQSDKLHAYLPFPETVAASLKPGQTAYMRLPGRDTQSLTGQVTDIRPMVGNRSHAIHAIVEFDNPGDWRPGGSITGVIVVAEREGSVTIPELAVVRRPAGEVVYVVDGDTVAERPVASGIRRDGWVEILEGLSAGDTVAKDGAGFLTDGARVRLTEG